MAEQLGGKGNVIVDRGLAGAPISAQLQNGYEAVLAKYPDIKIVGYYNGEYALGPEQAGVAALLAANPQVDGILTQGYGSGAMQALKDAGRPMVPVTGFSYNGSARRLRPDRGRQVHPRRQPGLALVRGDQARGRHPRHRQEAGGARRRGRRRLHHHRPLRRRSSIPNAKMQKIEIGENVFPDLPPGLTLPITPDWVEITPAEAAGAS